MLITKLLTNQIYLDSARMHAASCHYDLTAEALRAETVMADAGCRAGKIAAQTNGIGRAGCIPYSADTALHIGNDLVHAGYNDHVGRSLDQAGNPIAVSVDVNKFAVQSNRVGAHKEVIGENSSCIDLPCFLR